METMSIIRRLLPSLLAPGLIVLATAVVVAVPHGTSVSTAHSSYPSVVCPGALRSATTAISLPTTVVQIRSIKPGSTTLHRSKKLRFPATALPTFVTGSPGSIIASEKISGTSDAVTSCSVGSGDEWFIGGSGGVSNQGVLEVVNSGLSDSTVQIFPFSTHGALAPITVVIKPNSDRIIPLAALAPGEESMAIHMVTQSGRVTSFLLDHRKRGLAEIGSSFVAPEESAKTQTFLGPVRAPAPKESTSSVTMRLLVPGDFAANIHVTIHTATSSFTPLGLDTLNVGHQKVVDVKLPQMTISGAYGIEIASDQPVFASALWKTANDFAWTSALAPISQFQANLAGARAVFAFMGPDIRISAQWIGASGKRQKVVVTGQGERIWSPKGVINQLQLRAIPAKKNVKSREIYGGAILDDGGISSIGLQGPTVTQGSLRPISDLRVLTHIDRPGAEPSK
jgi:hypothetical protein